MPLRKGPYSRQDVQIVKKQDIFAGFFRLAKVQLRHRLFSGGWSAPVERELFEKAEAAAAVIYDPVGDLIGLVEQFRVGMLNSPLGPWSLEGVAGMVEAGESPETLICRELQEEAGIRAYKLLPITAFYPTPGSCNEYVHLYCALCDLSGAGGCFGLADEGEDILFQVYSASEVFDAMLESRTNNAATLIGLQWLQIQRPQLRVDYPRGDEF